MKKLSLILALSAFVLTGTQVQARGTGSADSPLKILRKPTPTSQGCSESQGRANLLVTFGSNGTIEEVTLKTSSGCDAFDRSSLDAARRIEFAPATKDDKPVTVTKAVVYEYNRY